jgi:hypothetical protein
VRAEQRKEQEKMKLSRYEQETVINFNAGEDTATLYTRDKAVMRKVDALVIEFPEVYRCIKETEYDKTYEMPKAYISYRKPRRLTEEQREQQRERMKIISNNKKSSNTVIYKKMID